jgi:DNA-binding response OmpR family regulator
MPQTILIADDDTELCALLREYFGQEGFDVRLAYDGEQALVESRRPGLDVMVLDIMMPGMNGIDVLRNLRKESELPVIMLTARESLRLISSGYLNHSTGLTKRETGVPAVMVSAWRLQHRR